MSNMSEPWQWPNQFFPYSLSVSCWLLRISDRFYLILPILSPADPSAYYPGQPQGLDLLLGAGANHSQIHAALQGPSEVALIQWDGWDHPREWYSTCLTLSNMFKSSSPSPHSSPVCAFRLTCGMYSLCHNEHVALNLPNVGILEMRRFWKNRRRLWTRNFFSPLGHTFMVLLSLCFGLMSHRFEQCWSFYSLTWTRTGFMFQDRDWDLFYINSDWICF